MVTESAASTKEKLIPLTVLVSPNFKKALEIESIRLGHSSLSEMVRDKLRYCLPENIRNLINSEVREAQIEKS